MSSEADEESDGTDNCADTAMETEIVEAPTGPQCTHGMFGMFTLRFLHSYNTFC